MSVRAIDPPLRHPGDEHSDEQVAKYKTSFVQQFLALMRKNLLLKMRTPFTTAVEVLLPVAVLALMVAIRTSISKKDVAENLQMADPLSIFVNSTDYTQGLNETLFFIREFADQQIGVAPRNAFTEWMDGRVNAMFGLDVFRFFSSEDSMLDYVRNKRYGKFPDTRPLYYGIVFERTGANASGSRIFSYRMLLNMTADGGDIPPTQLPNTFEFPATDDLQVGLVSVPYRIYGGAGRVLLMQIFFEGLMREYVGAQPVRADLDYRFQPFPTVKHIDDDFVDLVGPLLGLFFALVYIWPVSRIAKLLVEEKESKMRELLKMMSLRPPVIWLTWLCTYAVMFLVTAALIIAVAGTTVYEFSNKGLVLLYFWLYSLTVFAFAFMISSIYSKALAASRTSSIVFLVIFFPFFALTNAEEGQRTMACLSAPICFGLGASTIAELEKFEVGLQNDSLDIPTSQKLRFGNVIAMFVVDFVLYMLIGLYADRVVKSEYGVSESPCFCFMSSFWCPRRKGGAGVENLDMAKLKNFEPVGAELQQLAKVKVRGLKKDFLVNNQVVHAVQDFTSDLFEGQIFALLGHNGAGKSTTIHMLSGLYEPSDGNAVFYGASILSELALVRESLGVCPQHNVIYPILTVREHLTLIANIKGVPVRQIDAEVRETIERVGLTEKVDAKAGTLSGGQQRKLCVGMALIGGSRVVFLDEPTSGMDPYSRRSTWDLLRRSKQGRVIILTTHFMDEADQLGDRIAIMAKGTIRCCGSSLFLKSIYGVGYTMVLTKHEEAKNDALMQLVKQHCPEGQLLSSAAGEISFRLPFSVAPKLPELLRFLDAKKDAIGVDSYSVSVTTLEEVFLRVGHDADVEIEEVEKNKRAKAELSRLRASEADRKSAGAGDDRKSDGGGAVRSEPSVTKEDFNALNKQTAVNTNPANMTFANHFMVMIWKRWLNTKRDRKGLMWQIVYPFLVMLVGIGLVKLGQSIDFPKARISTSIFNMPLVVPVNDGPNFASWPTSRLTPDLGGFAGSNLQRLPVNVTQRLDMATFLLDSYKRYDNETSRYGAYLVNGFNSTYDSVTIFFNTTARDAMPIFFNLYSNMLLRTDTGDSNSFITAEFKPFPRSADEETLNTSLTAVMLSIAFAFIPSSIVAWIVYERANKSKHQQLISGVNVVAYWVSTYVWDVVLFLIPALLCIIVIAIYDISELLNDGFGALILGLILYATSITPFTYVISFLFQSHTEAQNTMLIVYIFTGAILLIVSVVLFIIESTRDVNNHLRYVYRLLPNYCFGELLSNVIIRSAQVVWGRPRDAFDMDIAGYPLVFMAWESVFYFLCVLGIEFVLRRPDIMSIFFPTPQVTDPPSEEDEDVVAEKQRVAALDGTKDKDVVVVKGLRKVYPTRLGAPPKVAVREVWLGVHEGECFGLLGINGAGKTTTLKMLTADEIPTSGTAVIDGLDVATQQNDIRHRMGYCPQFDAIIETLTAREQLKLYARIKGLPPQVIDEYVARLIIQLGLSEYADKPCGGYSGGNKRKLSLGISLIGNPRVMFLDEPSTGMDPGARRFMWDLISSSMAGRSVILTTHSMEECEALCQRIGIMVGGRMRCLGTASHLKERYGYGYQLDVNTGVHPTDKVLAFVHERFPGAKILERQQQNIKFRVPRQGTTLADLFEMIESNKARLDVSEYSVSETTLEQIFIHFARQQEEELGQLDAFAEDSFAGARPELAAGGTGAAAPPAKDTELVQVKMAQ